ncbi:bifunctional cobalt-precorrin-7 (C(5))-methyltransferase/cobalt-precorrin-6B (C(15))-methyltransferase [Sinorhizobium arboris]|uniref:bifunctional cobalt-precorrin-7 (C(5))-methyltransferase/cobalt-precorrin-6B (C(15))-methyltransferase n=1 Tax=Sinorhizobium arboris TaxID=76745 RepID=UPI0004824B9C|nr:bifunctional cobalt-precorrin-7 (C(5))-methyltransferase/cobalt-precorrin-6B (C(15))-methyltransferase [Sinorhizobium arboris]
MSNSGSAIVAPWLTVIGIGEDGVAGLGDEAKRLIKAAPVVFGGARHMQLAAPLIDGECHIWQSPFERSVEAIIARRGSPVVVLASGDPFLYGAGATLARRIDAAEMHTIPAPSAFSLAASRLGWPLQEVTTVSLHGRPIDLIRPHLQPRARVLALTSDENGPKALAGLLSEIGFGQSQLTVLEALGGERERVSRHCARDFALEKVDALNVCALEVVADADARVLPLASGLDDRLFEHDGQITKREVRALTLSALAPREGELLWDIGAGSGSIAIEWLLADPAMRAIAIEASPERAARIGRNAARFGVPGLAVVEGRAPDALRGLPRPDAVFIGGGGSETGVMEAVIDALAPGGRLVANAVTTEMEALLLARHARLGGSLIRIDIARVSPIGAMTGWRPAMPVTQWSWVKA